MTVAEKKEQHAVEALLHGQAECEVPVSVPGKPIWQTAKNRGLSLRERSGQEMEIEGKKLLRPLE